MLFIKTKRRFFCCLSFFFLLILIVLLAAHFLTINGHNQVRCGIIIAYLFWGNKYAGQFVTIVCVPFPWVECFWCHKFYTAISQPFFFFCYTMLFAGLSYPFWKVNGCTYKHASSFAVLFLLYYLCANFSSFSSFSKFLTFYYSAFLGLSGYPALLFCKICLWPLESFFDN